MRHCGNLTPMWAISRVQAFQPCEAAVTIHPYMWESADISWALISKINKSYEMRKSNDGQEKLNLFLTQEIFLHGFEREWGASLASGSSRQNRLTLDARSGVVHQIQSIVQLDTPDTPDTRYNQLCSLIVPFLVWQDWQGCLRESSLLMKVEEDGWCQI